MGSENMVVKVAIDSSVFSGIKDNVSRNKEVKRLFRECGKFGVKSYLPPTVIVELAHSPLIVKGYVIGLADAGLINETHAYYTINKKKSTYKKLRKRFLQDLKNNNIKIKTTDALIYLECALIPTNYLITYDKNHLLNDKIISSLNYLLKKYELKPAKTISPKEFINRILYKRY